MEDYWGDIVAGLTEGVMFQAADGTLQLWNQAAEHLCGFTAEQFRSPPAPPHPCQLIHEDGSPCPEEEHPSMLALAMGRPLADQVRGLLRPDGGVTWLAISSTPLVHHGEARPRGVVVSFRDITAQKQAQERQRQEEARLRILTEAAPVAIYETDAAGNCLFVNQKWCEYAGLTPEEAQGEGWARGLHPEDRERVHEAWKVHAQDQIPWSLEYRFQTPQGRVTWVAGTAVALRDGDGRITGYLGTNVDITAQKAVQEERARLEVDLRQAQKMRAVGTLAGGIAHEFNNLLAAIVGYTDLARELLVDRPRVHDYLSRVLDASCRARDLIRQLLTFSQRSDSRAKLVDLPREIRRTRQMLAQILPPEVAIATEVAPDLAAVNLVGSLDQILVNLAGNAVDAMPHGGRLAIQARNVYLSPRACPTCGQKFAGEFAEIRVQDNGQGMDDKTVARIFDPFFTTKEVGSGTGLGLSVAQGMIRASGGHIACESRLGGGATFTIHLPLASASAGSEPLPELAAGRRPGWASRARLLVAEDEPPVRELLRRVLQQAGYQLCLAASGEEALNFYQRPGPGFDLVLLDLGMPGLGGRRCLEELLAGDPGVKVLVVSGYASPATERQVRAAGAAGFLAKPFRSQELLAAVEALLARD
ncbi:MAG: PAS domain S-box protein [Deltaproteobacteria bacterium]|nr:PAS domain S-box protein [Deltaproteobacteria bacterium]